MDVWMIKEDNACEIVFDQQFTLQCFDISEYLKALT